MGITKGRKIRSGINTLLRDDTTEMVSSIKKMVIKFFCRMGGRGIRTVDLLGWTDDKIPSKIDGAVDGFRLLDDGSKKI